MKKLIILLCVCCFLSCTASPPAKPKLELTISERMYGTVTCRLKDEQLVWSRPDAPKTFVIRAKRDFVAPYVSSQTGEISAQVYLHKYTPTEPDAPLKEISFFNAIYSVKGVEYKRLVSLPEECSFWLQEAGGYYLITNVVGE